MNDSIVRILLIEDNPGDARLTQEALREGELEHELMVEEDGDAALAYLRSQEDDALPDLVLLDLNLPRLDGRGVLAAIKADPRLRRIPVVILTTSSAKRDIEAAYDLHANCYIIKPVDLDSFMDAIRAIEQFWFNAVRLPGGGK